jgi:hypothetical protein
MKLGTYIMARERISTAYFINPSHHPVCLCVSPIFARQRLGQKNLMAATNTHATIKQLLVASFSMRSMSYEGKQAISFSQNFLFVTVFMSFGTVTQKEEPFCRSIRGRHNVGIQLVMYEISLFQPKIN